MKDSSEVVTVLVSSPALEICRARGRSSILSQRSSWTRKSFERIASTKYENGFVEPDGTVFIRAMDIPPSVN